MRKLTKMALLAGCLLAVACNKQDENPKWEYKAVGIAGRQMYEGYDGKEYERANRLGPRLFYKSELEDSLKAAGKEGWELVDIVTTLETTHPNFGDEKYVSGLQPNTRTMMWSLVFKRKVTAK